MPDWNFGSETGKGRSIVTFLFFLQPYDKEYVTMIYYAIIGMVTRDGIAVTQDYGLAAMILAKGASAIDQNSMVYTADNIDSLLERQYI